MRLCLALMLAFSSQWVFANGLPLFSLQPTNESVFPGGTAILAASAAGATGYQWQFDGTNIPSATNVTIQITNLQITNTGYYLVTARNSAGWVPSQMVYLSINYNPGGIYRSNGGKVPFSNTGNTYFLGQIGYPGNWVQIMAGPELDQIQPAGAIWFYGGGNDGDGSFDAPDQSVNTVAPGQNVYYSILVTATNDILGTYLQPSTVMLLVAGGNTYPTPSNYGLKFPDWPEWPEPNLFLSPATNQTLVSGETLSFTNQYGAYDDFGVPTVQWRKDGNNIPGATNFNFFGNHQSVFAITNVQVSDAGVYDAIIYGNDWVVSPRIYVSIQAANDAGIFQNPSYSASNFVCTLLGAPGRNYQLQGSTNLVNWVNLVTLANITGTLTFTNSSAAGNVEFYRTVLLP